MIERVLVPLDGSATAESVLPHVRRLLKRVDAEAILLRVEQAPLATMNDMGPLLAASGQAVRDYVLRLRDELAAQGARARAVTRLGGAAPTILEVAEEERVSMIAMATHGRTGLSHLLFGSIAEAVLRAATVPVLIVRPFTDYDLKPPARLEDEPIHSILVPLDGTRESLGVLPQACDLAALFGSQLHFLRVLDPRSVSTPRRRSSVPPAAVRDKARFQLEQAARRCGVAGVPTRIHLEVGAPAEQILAVSAREGIELIAMATRGRTGLSRLFSGSVTEDVLRHGKVPLLAWKAVERVPAGEKVRGRPFPLAPA